jgi:hypothetical protein
VAIRALTEDSERRVVAIMELRAYARTKAAIDAAPKPEDEPTGPMADWVWRVKAERMRQRKAERKRKAGRG